VAAARRRGHPTFDLAVALPAPPVAPQPDSWHCSTAPTTSPTEAYCSHFQRRRPAANSDTGSATRSPPNYNRQTPTTTRNRDGARARRRRRSRTSRNAATAYPAPCGSVKVRLHSPRGTWLHLEAQVALAKFFQLGAGSYVAPTVRTVQALPREDWLPRALPGCGAAARADLRSSPSRCAAGRSRCSAHSVLAYRIRGR